MRIPHLNQPSSRKTPQRGAAFIVMLVILVMGVATVLVSSLSSAGLKIARDEKTAEVLAQAKDALIGNAASDIDLANRHYPGSLPCPDTDDDGAADAGGGSECPQYIGRLPWKTLGLPDLRDASGERLWYTLSRNVRRYAAVRPLNSDTQGTLNVAGSFAAGNQIAIVFAPGRAISGQSRSTAQTAPCPSWTPVNTSVAESLCAKNYLEGTNDNPSPGAAPNVAYQSSDAGIDFNDQLITISHDQLFATVEKRVAREIKTVLNTYDEAWRGTAPVGAYPFAAIFASPSVSFFRGSASPATYSGLLPVGDDVQPTWADLPNVDFPSGGGSIPGGACELRNGLAPNGDPALNSRWRCDDIILSAGKTIVITATLNNVGRGLWRPYNINNICEVRAKDASDNNVLITTLLDNVSVTGTLNTDGSATIVLQGQGKTGGSSLNRIELRDIKDYATDIVSFNDYPNCSTQQPTTNAPLIPKWLFNNPTHGNNWHHVAYYSVAEKFSPGRNRTCAPTPCLTVNGTANNNAVVIMTGRTIAGAHPSGTLSDYLEGQNLTPADYTFENQPRSATFNDQVIVVAP
jgi:hypothetical protein